MAKAKTKTEVDPRLEQARRVLGAIEDVGVREALHAVMDTPQFDTLVAQKRQALADKATS